MRRLLLLFILLTPPAGAEVTDVATNGFTTVNELTIRAEAIPVWRAATRDIAAWWDPAHTLSGDATRLSIDATPMGCFCEDFGEDAGFVHLTVTGVSPGSLLRLTGGLGPLGVMGVNGNMTWEFERLDDGTRVRFTYVVGGYAKGGLDGLAQPVDNVIGEALRRLARYVETGSPDSDD